MYARILCTFHSGMKPPIPGIALWSMISFLIHLAVEAIASDRCNGQYSAEAFSDQRYYQPLQPLLFLVKMLSHCEDGVSNER